MLLMDRGITNPPVLIGRTFFDAGFQIRRDAIWRDYVWNFDGIDNKNTSRRSIYCIGTYFFVCRDVVVATSGCNFSRVVGCLESPLRAYSYISKNLYSRIFLYFEDSLECPSGNLLEILSEVTESHDGIGSSMLDAHIVAL